MITFHSFYLSSCFSLSLLLSCLLPGRDDISKMKIYHNFVACFAFLATISSLTYGADVSINAEGRASYSPLGIDTDNFERSVKNAKDLSNSISANIGTVKSSIDDIETVINIPRNIRDLADEVDDTLRSVKYALSVVGIIPPIKVVSRALSKAIDRVRPKVQTAERTAGKVDRKLKSAKTRMDQVESKVNRFHSQVRRLITTEDVILFRVGSLKRIVNESPSSIKENLDNRMDDLTGGMTPLVNQFNSAQQQSVLVLGDTIDDARVVRDLLSSLTEISDAIQDVRDILEPVRRPLKSLENALDTDVCVNVYFTKVCLSIKDVLDGVDWLAGWAVDILVNLAMGVLQPILDTLRLPSDLPDIPGLDKINRLERALNDFEVTMTNTIRHFDDTYMSVIGYMDQFNRYNGQLSQLEANFCVDYGDFCNEVVRRGSCSVSIESQMCRKSCNVC